MTEQPPSAFDLRGWLRDRNRLHVDDFVNQTMEHINAYAERVCEQRVSAETERCATVALEQRGEHTFSKPTMVSYAAGDRTPWDLACTTIADAIRAPAQRPAPPKTEWMVDPPRGSEWQ